MPRSWPRFFQPSASCAHLACIAAPCAPRARAGSGDRHRVVEEDHDAVAGEVLERALVRHDQRARSRRGTRAARPSPPRARRVSVNAVKPRRSRNTTVISRRWLFSGSSAPPARISSATAARRSASAGRRARAAPTPLGHALLERAVPARAARRLRCTSSYSDLMRSSERTRASSSGWLTGLVRKSSAPASMPLTRSCCGSSAVTSTTGSSAVRRVGADRAADVVAAHARASSRRAARGPAAPRRPSRAPPRPTPRC